MMKKTVLLFCVVCLFAFCLPLSAANPTMVEPTTVTDPRTGLTYVSYETTHLSLCKWEKQKDGTLSARCYYTQTLYVPPKHAYVQDLIEQRFAEHLKFAAQHVPTVTDTIPCSFLNGYVRTATEADVYYWQLFDLPTDYKGTTVITKKGVPFTVTGDGNGNLSIQVKTDMYGYKTVYFEVPLTDEEEIGKAEKIESSYDAVHRLKNDPAQGWCTKTFDSLEEAVDHCTEHADPRQRISISGAYQYTVYFDPYEREAVRLQVDYGNPGRVSATVPPTSATATTTTSTTKANTTAANTTTANTTTANTTTQTTSIPDETITTGSSTTTVGTGTAATSAANDATLAGENEEEPPRTSVWWYTLPPGIVLLCAATGCFIYFKKREKNS